MLRIYVSIMQTIMVDGLNCDCSLVFMFFHFFMSCFSWRYEYNLEVWAGHFFFYQDVFGNLLTFVTNVDLQHRKNCAFNDKIFTIDKYSNYSNSESCWMWFPKNSTIRLLFTSFEVFGVDLTLMNSCEATIEATWMILGSKVFLLFTSCSSYIRSFCESAFS